MKSKIVNLKVWNMQSDCSRVVESKIPHVLSCFGP